MKKLYFTLAALLCGVFFTAYGLEVAVEELQNVTPVEFVNYTGAVEEADAASAIRNIGRNLAGLTANENQQYAMGSRYSIIEATNSEEDGLYSAAILSIDPQARVNHIRNVRQIVAGFLEGKYNYSAQEADTLAYFLSFYNAIYRGDLSYLRSEYKPEIFNFVNEQNAGIARVYSEWPGRTRFITPLTEKSNVMLSQLGSNITGAARANDPNMAISQREALNQMKEASIAQDRQEIAQRQETLAQQQQEARQAAAQASAAQNQAAAAAQRAQTAQTAADRAAANNAPNAAALQQQADEAQARADEAQAKADEESQNAAQAQQAAQSTQQQNERQQQEAAVKQQQVEEERRQLQQDRLTQEARNNPEKVAADLAAAQQQLEGKSPFVGNKFYYMNVMGYSQDGHYKNEMAVIDPDSGAVLNRSPNNICTPNFVAYGNGVAVITETSGKPSGPHALTILDLETLQIKAINNDINIFWRSFIELIEGKLYAVALRSGNGNNRQAFLVRFNERLELEAQSEAQIDIDTSITAYQDKIYVNMSGQKRILVLNKSDLKQIAEINL